jgi:hypothetical protein
MSTLQPSHFFEKINVDYSAEYYFTNESLYLKNKCKPADKHSTTESFIWKINKKYSADEYFAIE